MGDFVEGLFGWADCVCTDVAAGSAFYSAMFGWEVEERPIPGGPPYLMFRKDGKKVAGMGPVPPGAPEFTVWNNYVLVHDLDSVLAEVPGSGGQVVMPAMDVLTEGRMAMIADPGGAVLGLWQPGDHVGAEVFTEVGTMAWNDLTTRDLASAVSFYEALLPWQFEAQPGDPNDYRVIMLDGKDGDDKSNGGAMTTPPTVPDSAPNYWAVYFAVADCGAAVERAESLGGRVMIPPTQAEGMTFAGLFDPTGGFFMVVSFTEA